MENREIIHKIGNVILTEDCLAMLENLQQNNNMNVNSQIEELSDQTFTLIEIASPLPHDQKEIVFLIVEYMADLRSQLKKLRKP